MPSVARHDLAPSNAHSLRAATREPGACRRRPTIRLLAAVSIAVGITGCGARESETATISFGASAQQLTATWTNNATNADGIYVDRCTGSDCADFSRLTALAPSATTYADTAVLPSSTYCYRVGAFNGAGVGWSGKVCAAVPEAPSNPPSAPDATVPPPAIDAGLRPAENDFPLDMTGATPQTRRVALVASLPAQPQQAVLTLERVVDPDFADEGSLTINGHGPIALFGDEVARDGETVDINFATPASWWQDGANELVFTHERTQGYVVGGALVSFATALDAGPPIDPEPDAALPAAPAPDAALPPVPEPDAALQALDAVSPRPVVDAGSFAPPSAEARGDLSCEIITADGGSAQVSCDVSRLEAGCSLTSGQQSHTGILWGGLLLLGLVLRRRRAQTSAFAKRTRGVGCIATSIILVIGMAAASTQAATYYVRAGAGGDGSSWSSAYSDIPSRQAAGATYYLATGTYGSLVISADGVTLRKATVGDHGTAAGWSDSYAVGTVLFDDANIKINANDVTIDGATGGGPGSWTNNYGIKVNGGTAHYDPVIWIGQNGARHSGITLRHVEVEGNHGDGAGHGGSGNDAIQASSNQDNITVAYAWLHDTGRCLLVTRSGNLLLEYIYGGKYEYDLAGEHSEVMVADAGNFPQSPDTTHYVRNITVRNSIFTHVEGTGGIMLQVDGAEIYGNVFYQAPTDGTWDYCWNGVIGVHDYGALLRNVRVYHNTFIDATRSRGTNCGSDRGNAATVFGYHFGLSFNGPNHAYNNLFYKDSAPALDYVTAHDSNYYVNLSRGAVREANSLSSTVSGSPFVDETQLDFRLSTNAPGKALDSSYNAVDPNGNPRTTHTRGAYEYASATVARPSAPTNLRISN